MQFCNSLDFLNCFYQFNYLQNKVCEITPYIELEIFLNKLKIIDNNYNINKIDNDILNKLKNINNSNILIDSKVFNNKYIKFLIDNNLKNILNESILRTYVILLKDKKNSTLNFNFFCIDLNVWNNVYQNILNNEFGKFIQSFC